LAADRAPRSWTLDDTTTYVSDTTKITRIRIRLSRSRMVTPLKGLMAKLANPIGRRLAVSQLILAHVAAGATSRPRTWASACLCLRAPTDPFQSYSPLYVNCPHPHDSSNDIRRPRASIRWANVELSRWRDCSRWKRPKSQICCTPTCHCPSRNRSSQIPCRLSSNP